MSIQEVKDAWIFLDRNTGVWPKQLQSAQGVFQPIHWVAMHRMQCMLRLIPHEGRIADIGCSYGILTLNMAWKKPRAEVVGIDPDESRLEVGRQLVQEHHLPNCRFVKGTVAEPGIEPGSCSGVICTETLDHIRDIRPHMKEAVDQLLGLLLPGGRLIISIPSLEEMGKETAPLPPSPLSLHDFDFLKNKQIDRNCPRWWHLFYVDKL
ncbi:MAG TPA: class I SAM-dependent methyltransferase [Planctomycetota bacterium]|jgi:2-polyprenyl-3-methyl-5-hydroxy-6-metoxy-1,4-benzoquinol methylase